MPYFYYEGNLDIEVDEFLDACDKKEKEELIDALIEDGYIKPSQRTVDEKLCAAEEIFEESLSTLHGKWNRLTKEEEIIIMTIAKRFL